MTAPGTTGPTGAARPEEPSGPTRAAAGRELTVSALSRWRPMAWVVGTMLLVLVLVAMPVKYVGGDDRLVGLVSPVHGLLFIGYVLVTLQLSRRVGWSLPRTLLLMLAGTVPFVSFVAERRVTRQVREQLAAVPAVNAG